MDLFYIPRTNILLFFTRNKTTSALKAEKYKQIYDAFVNLGNILKTLILMGRKRSSTINLKINSNNTYNKSVNNESDNN